MEKSIPCVICTNKYPRNLPISCSFHTNSSSRMNRIMPQKEETKGAAVPAKGWVTVKVGEEQQRFTVPVEHLSHPMFAELLAKAAEEYGFSQPGVIVIPCGVDHFHRVEEMIERGYGDGHRRRRLRHDPFNFP